MVNKVIRKFIHIKLYGTRVNVFVYFYRGVSANILNDKKQSPIHLATELNKVTALKVMGNYRNIIDIQKGGEHGRTALHLAAIYDHEECARILVRWVMQNRTFVLFWFVSSSFFHFSHLLCVFNILCSCLKKNLKKSYQIVCNFLREAQPFRKRHRHKCKKISKILSRKILAKM